MYKHLLQTLLWSRLAIFCGLFIGATAYAQSGAIMPGTGTIPDAHNCYPYDGRWNDRIDRALSAGLPIAIEQDLDWYVGAAGGTPRLVVSHGGTLTGSEPGLETYFFERIRPVVEKALASPDHSKWPIITLNLDLKTEHPAELAAIWAVLTKYQAWLTTAPRTADTGVQSLHVGPILVLNGPSDAQQKAFYDDVPLGGRLLSFGAVHTNEHNPAAAASTIETEAATNYRRWWNNPWKIVEPAGQQRAGEWTPNTEARLHELVSHAHRQGLWIRFYTLDGATNEQLKENGWFPQYNFPTRAAAEVRWRAAVAEGVDYLASDQYEDEAAIIRQSPHTDTAMAGEAGDRPHVLMISIDGMRPDYATAAQQHGLHLPTLREFMRRGTYADGVKGVLPTITFPSHTTLITGVWPAKHGISNNTVFDPMHEHAGDWYWYARSIRSETLWQAASAAGLKTASIGWPVTTEAPGIDYLITSITVREDGKTKTVNTDKPADLDSLLAGESTGANLAPDERKTIASIALIRRYNPEFMTVHLTALDHAEHETGPFSQESDRSMEVLDAQIGKIVSAELAAAPHAIVIVVSDHGQAALHTTVNLNVLLIKAGLLKLHANSTEPASWKVALWPAGGSAALVVQKPISRNTTKALAALLDHLRTDQKYGVDRVLNHDEILREGGPTEASWMIVFKPGYQAGDAYTGEEVKPSGPHERGTHGYAPALPDVHAAFFAIGEGVAQGRDLGLIDMRQIAPTVAEMLGVSLPEASEPVLHYKP